MTRTKNPETAPTEAQDTQPMSPQQIEPTASVSLPSPLLKHDGVLVRELTTRLSQFDTALEVVVAEKEGRIVRHEEQIAELTEKHNLGIAELERQAKDIDTGRRRLLRALAEEEGE